MGILKHALILIIVPVLLIGCSEKPGEKAGEKGEAAPPANPAETPSRVHRGTNGEITITLDLATQKLMGLETTPVSAAQLSPEVKGYGRVLDISPLASQVAELAGARAVSQASQAELERLKTLAAQSNASQRALQAGEAAAVRDQAQAESARLRLLAAWGSAIAERQDLPELVQRLGSLSSALVEIDLPPDQPMNGTPTGARLVALADESAVAEGLWLGSAPAVDPQLQGRGFLFLVATNSPRLAPGAALTGYLSWPGEALAGVAVPREAIIRFNGAAWVYRQNAEQTFERVETALESPLANGWFVRGALKPGDKLVTGGAQQLLSEELKGEIEKPD
jgi:hypothetical protein